MNYNKIAVIDLEATCWEGDPPPNEIAEIIEIGICDVEHSNGVIIIEKPKQIKVRPNHSKISEFCTKLTGWTWQDLKHAFPYAAACKQLIKNGLRNKIFGSWGNDQEMIIEQAKLDNVKLIPVGTQYINIQNMYNLMVGSDKRIALETVLEQLKLSFKGQQHRARDDAYNTARILAHIINKYSQSLIIDKNI